MAIPFQMWMPSRCIGTSISRPAAPVPADRHVDLAGHHQGGAAAGGAAGGEVGMVGVADRAGVGGEAAAGEAEVLADGLAEDLAAGVEDAGDDGGVGLGDVALEDR